MIRCVVILIGLAGVADAPGRLDSAHRIVDAAMDRVWADAEPREVIGRVLLAAIQVDPAWAVGRIRAASDRLARGSLPPRRENVQAALAALVAPHDRKLRDEILGRAIADGRLDLAQPGLWESGVGRRPPGGFGFGDPQGTLDRQKRALAFRIRLWETLAEPGGASPAAPGPIVGLFVEELATTPPLISDSINGLSRTRLELDLADLDPAIFLAVAPGLWGKDPVARF